MTALRMLGPGLWVALVLLAAAAWLAWDITPGWQAQAAARVPAPPEPGALVAAPAANPTVLPAAEAARERVAALLALATRHGVQLQRVDARLQRQQGAEHLALGMQVRGAYPGLRAFVEAALAADAALALDSMRLQRDGPDAAELQAELGWALHHRPGAAEPTP